MPQNEPTQPALPPGAREAPSFSEPRGAERRAVDIALYLALLGLFAYLALELIRPFGGMLLWTVVIAAALYPVFRWVSAHLGGRPRLAAALVTVAALAIVLGPIAMLATSLIDTVEWLVARLRSGEFRLPQPPQGLLDAPVVGKAVAANWELATTNLDGFLARYGRTLVGAGEAAVLPTIHFAEGMARFLAAVALSGFLLVPGERLGAALRRTTRQLMGAQGARFVDIAGATIRNVARGVIGVAMIQALIFGVGLIVAGVPGAGVLTLVSLVLAIVQIGVWPVAAPIILWAWLERDATTAALLTAYLVPASLIDIPLKPMVLGKALKTPALVIFAGVIGGTISYGLIGLFLGPIVLAIVYEIASAGLDGASGAAVERRGGIE